VFEAIKLIDKWVFSAPQNYSHEGEKEEESSTLPPRNNVWLRIASLLDHHINIYSSTLNSICTQGHGIINTIRVFPVELIEIRIYGHLIDAFHFRLFFLSRQCVSLSDEETDYIYSSSPQSDCKHMFRISPVWNTKKLTKIVCFGTCKPAIKPWVK